MKVRITPLYVAAAFIVILILISTMFTIGLWMGLWGDVEVYAMIQTFIINWVVVITFAILGGVLFGMFAGYRMLSSQGFTPFEKSMLHMFKEVQLISERVENIENTLMEMQGDEPGNNGLSDDGKS